jgi:hypothetical protein
MASPITDSKSHPLTKATANRNRRKIVQIQHEEEFQAALVNTKDKYVNVNLHRNEKTKL